MSMNEHRGIPPGNAAIIAAVIGAGALLLGALIGVLFGAKSQTIQVFLGADTPTAIAQSNILGLPLPQPTYTLLPTYTPYPTFTPPRAVVTQAPVIITATPSADQQNPLPSSTILAGQGYTRNGVTVTLRKSIEIRNFDGGYFGFTLSIENRSGQQWVIVWRNSFIHLRDDKGRVYRQWNEDAINWNKNKQFTISNSGTQQLVGTSGNVRFDYDGDTQLDFFQGTIDPSTKYFIFTLDQMAGMTNMSWRYDILQ